MAMTAWAAKVWSSAIWVSENHPGSSLTTVIAPMGSPARIIGTDSRLRQPILKATSRRYS